MKSPISKLNLIILLSASLSMQAGQLAPHIITFFFRPFEKRPKVFDAEALKDTISTPGKITRSLMKKNLADRYHVNGIFVTYAGYSEYSSCTGQVVFPRESQKPIMKIIVAQSIKPIFYPDVDKPAKTVNYWQVTDQSKAKYYQVELKQVDPEGDAYWFVTKKDLPKNRKIPRDAIVIFAEPKHIWMPKGRNKRAASSPHFMLPDVYVSFKISPSLGALRFLKVKKYFSPIKFAYQFGEKEFSQKIEN